MQIVNIKVKDLKPYAKNAKKHPQEQIDRVAKSIELTKGLKQPIVIDSNKSIVVGHGRVLACKQLGIEEVPCVYCEGMTDEEIKAYRLADNKTNESDWDFDLLGDSLDEIFDIDMSAFGFDLELDEPQDIIEDEAPEVDEENEPTAKLGDIWQLGRHRLMCGDSTDKECVEKLMNGCLADMLLTDPPYNVDYQGKTKDALKIQNDKMDNDSFRQFLRDAFFSADSVMKKGAVFYIWHADSEGYNFRGACFDINWNIRQCLIWNKNSIVLGRQDYHWKHEPCLYGWKDGASHLWASDRKQSTVIDFQKPNKNNEHPTMKPVGLFDYQIKNNTKCHDVVLDLFLGSGTTLIACEQNERICYGLELDPRYVDVIIKRFENLTGIKAKKVEEI